jgi:hypothetical protein
MTASKPNTSTEISSGDQSRETQPVGAQVRDGLKGEIDRLAYEASTPHRDVGQSHVIRAALRFYIENCDDPAGSVYEHGGIDPSGADS